MFKFLFQLAEWVDMIHDMILYVFLGFCFYTHQCLLRCQTSMPASSFQSGALFVRKPSMLPSGTSRRRCSQPSAVLPANVSWILPDLAFSKRGVWGAGKIQAWVTRTYRWFDFIFWSQDKIQGCKYSGGCGKNPVKVAFPPEYLATSSDISKIQLCYVGSSGR